MYFTAKKRIDYFAVINNNKKKRFLAFSNNSALLIQPEKELFKQLKKDYKNIKYNFKKQVTIV
jgi:hypothetical protein